MRYIALLFLILFAVSLVVKKINKDYIFIECLFFIVIAFFISSVVGGLLFIFIKYW
jgi:hypothetical protein